MEWRGTAITSFACILPVAKYEFPPMEHVAPTTTVEDASSEVHRFWICNYRTFRWGAARERELNIGNATSWLKSFRNHDEMLS